MESIVIAAIVVAAILIKCFGHRETRDVIDRQDAGRRPKPPSARPAQHAPAAPTASTPVAPPPPRPKPKPQNSASKWTDCTPSPAGARHELSAKGQRALALVERARREGGLTIKGRVYVIDGDTIILQKTHIRLAGIDAPELEHPYGKASMWALRKLCAQQMISAEIKPEMSYDRAVAVCRLADGTDLAEALVRMGLALDWATFSGGGYRSYEPPDARKKLWKTAQKQGRGAC